MEYHQPKTRPYPQNRGSEVDLPSALKELLPPGVPPLLRWRLTIFFFSVFMLGFVIWAVSPYGFAMAGDQVVLRDDVTTMKITLVEQSLFDAKESECTSTDVGARRFFARRVLSLSREYYKMALVEANIPPCRTSL